MSIEQRSVQSPHAWGTVERRKAAWVLAAVGALHLVGWSAYLLHQQSFSAAGGLAAAGTTAYLLGLRHGFDADHVAVIDDATRLLMQRGRRPVSTGMWFALGHASVVLLLAFAVAFVAGPAAQAWAEEAGLRTGLFVDVVVVVVLGALAVLNAVVLRDALRLLRRARRGAVAEEEIELVLGRRGLMARVLRGRMRALVGRSWHLFGIGLLFGLGMQTATEVTVLAMVAPDRHLPAIAVLSLPLLFAAGMCTVDSVDGMLMSRAYTWSLARPLRRLSVNVTTTALTVVLAAVVALVVLAGALAELGLSPLEPVAGLGDHFELLGYLTLAAFMAVWGGAALWWRLSRSDDRAGGGPAPATGTPGTAGAAEATGAPGATGAGRAPSDGAP
ncbi:high-affinity nickel-transport protein [Saccharopolyspora erythraea NRRL 2338]|uniref:Nickel/cobalt efflux system n=2 Tax=Saccharopolyspora erythraea TaxID=1836 RepID=A4FM65_SACEN|nr:nickel transporter [Saccharopolyspora erythraea]EQD84618.1 nickel transporter [Saccharopolyspora erythraea D]PFG98777.1 high-affinity nickel-transport protein [Saccharopolyspora erythraea NRRL 2338]QRK88780.1 nickel transporter [Saccharopolyspora erythraea]CAM05140.1 high-affinity nickel-transport protein [Saccharopolyspora erythraea NRRL 2338]